MKAWYDLLFNSQNGALHYKSDLIGTIIVNQHDKKGVVLRRVTFQNCQIKKVAGYELDWSQNDIVGEVICDFVYDYFIDEYIDNNFTINPPFKIQDSAIVDGLTVLYDSYLEVSDFEADGGPSNLTLTLDNIVNAAWFVDRFEVQNLKFYNATIESRLSNEDLVLRSDGTGCVGVDDHFKLYLQTEDPGSVVNGVKLYAKNEAQGGTGLFFVNSENKQDELISKRKAIAYSMIF
jgi:hypothetical protein